MVGKLATQLRVGRALGEIYAAASAHSRLADLLPVIFMSGYTADVIEVEDVLADKLEFLQKPFTISELRHRVRTVLDTAWSN